MRAIEDKEDEIRKPVHIGYKIRKYRYLMNKAQSNLEPIPSDEELMEMLECSQETLELIKEKANESMVSAQTRIGDDEDTELGDMISDDEVKNPYEAVLDKITDQELLTVLKYKLRPIEYYFLYTYELDSNKEGITLEGMSSDFNITRERVRQIKKKAYDKAAKYVRDRNIRHLEAERIGQNTGIPVNKWNVKPYNIKEIIVYNYVKNKLEPVERRILANMLFGSIKMTNEELAKFFFLTEKEYEGYITRIKKKVANILMDAQAFNVEVENITKMYGTQIFMLVPEDEVLLSIANKDSLEMKLKRVGERKEVIIKRKERHLNNLINKAKLEDKSRNHDNIGVFNKVDINDEEMMLVLKNKLSDLEYYIFYELMKKKENMDEVINYLAKLFNISVMSVTAYKNRIEKKIIKFLEKEDFKEKELNNLKDKNNGSLDNLRVDPLNLNHIITYYFVKEYLNEGEANILRYLVFYPHKYKTQEFFNRFDISEDTCDVIMEELNRKVTILLTNEDLFSQFKKKMLKTYGIKILNSNLEKELADIDYANIRAKFDGYSFDEIRALYGDTWEYLDVNSQNLLKRYFSVPELSLDEEEWEEKFYLERENIDLEMEDAHLKPKVLYDCFLRHLDYFSKRDQLFLECYIFGVKERDEFDKVYKLEQKGMYKSYLLDKLEKLYFNVYNIMYSYSFSKEQWLKVLEKHEDKFSENRIIAMNMFYGVDGEALSILEIAEIFGTSYRVMHDFLANARKTAIALYINRSNLVDIDKDIYTPYVLDRAYPFTPLNREVLIMVLINGLSYAEVKEKLEKRDIKLKQNQISNMVKDCLRKIDTFRFGIVEANLYSKELVRDYLEVNKDKLTDIEKEFIKEKYINYRDNDDIAFKFKMEKSKVNKQVQRFDACFDKFKIADVELTTEDYLREFNTYPLERVVNKSQMHMLSYYYGIPSKYNPSGEKMGVPDMIENLERYSKERNEGLYRKIKTANDLIKLKKKGLYHNDLVYMPTDEVRKVMNDPHVPISDKERYIICSIYGIKHYAKKTLSELADIYKETENSIRRRYQRGFIAIYKYQNGEIPAKIDYEYDILPIMRYFSKYDRLLLEDFYKNGLSYERIAKKYKLTFNQVISRFNRLHLTVYEMINNPKGEYFDFDLYEKAIKDPLFPYYANLEEDVKIFDLHFANTQIKNYTANEIIKELNLNRDDKSIHKTIYNMLLAVCRYKYGIRKKHTYTYDDVVDYYERHKDNMLARQKIFYLKYFKRHFREDANRNKEYINRAIIRDIINERKKQVSDIDELSHDEIIDLMKTRHFSAKVLNGLLSKIGETERVVMSGTELNHVYRLLNRLDKTLKIDEKQKLSLTN